MDGAFIIDGLLFNPASDMLLCQEIDTKTAITVRIYATEKGNFYQVIDDLSEKDVRRIDREAAISYAHAHPAGTVNETYRRVFGNPERG